MGLFTRWLTRKPTRTTLTFAQRKWRHDHLFPVRRRSSLGPTRYVPRCSMFGCGKPLAPGRHVGACDLCRERLRAWLNAA